MLNLLNYTQKAPGTSVPTFCNIKNEILGKNYELSLVFVGDQRAKSLNLKYRNKGYNPNVLSFPLDESNGEIFINPNVALRESKKANMSYKKYIGFLFIHGCLHLKGLDHGDTMTKQEEKFLKKFF